MEELIILYCWDWNWNNLRTKYSSSLLNTN